MNLEKFISLLDTYKGRDRLIRLLCYVSKCAAGLSSRKYSTHLDILSKQLSSTRAALRLLDDLPTLMNVINYGFGKKNEDLFIRVINVISNIVDMIFCPIDHVSWAIDHGIIAAKTTIWDTLSSCLWVASLYLYIISCLRKISNILDKKAKLMESNNENKCSREMILLSEEQSKLILNTVKSVLDITFAINYLPRGILWSGSLSKWQIGALGSLSSGVALYQCLK